MFAWFCLRSFIRRELYLTDLSILCRVDGLYSYLLNETNLLDQLNSSFPKAHLKLQIQDEIKGYEEDDRIMCDFVVSFLNHMLECGTSYPHMTSTLNFSLEVCCILVSAFL